MILRKRMSPHSSAGESIRYKRVRHQESELFTSWIVDYTSGQNRCKIEYDSAGFAYLNTGHLTLSTSDRSTIRQECLKLLEQPVQERYCSQWITSRVIDDPEHQPACLIGQKEVVCVTDQLAQGCHVIAVYEGQVMKDHPDVDRMVSNTMLFEFVLPKQGRRKQRFVINGQRGGNACAPFINDYRINVQWDGDPRNDRSRINTTFMVVMNQGRPYVLLVTMGNVKRGDSLLTDYSPNYWRDYCPL